MARSRADDILEGWRMVTRNAVKAETAPRPASYRTGLPIGFAVAAIALILAVSFSLRAPSPAPQASQPGVVPSGQCGSGPVEASAACGTHGPTGAPGGLSREAAIAVALRLAPPSTSQPTVIWASIENDPFAAPGASSRPLVWEVRLEAPFAASPCPSGFLERMPSTDDPACLDAESGLIVVMDYFTGGLVGWLH